MLEVNILKSGKVLPEAGKNTAMNTFSYRKFNRASCLLGPCCMQLFLYLFSFILFFATSLLNELDKTKLQCKKTNLLLLVFTGSAVVTEISLLLLEGRQARGVFTYLLPQHSQELNLFAKYATVICCHFSHATESDSPAYNLLHNSAKAEDTDGLL